MSEDSYTEVTNESIFGRIKNAVFGIFFGMILIAGAVFLLFWNEGRTVKTYKSLKEGSGIVVSVDHERIYPENEGKLVHVSGLATTDDLLKDSIFFLSSNALALKRSVQMYQWQETRESKKRKKLGGGEETVTTYSYDRVWSTRVISSSNFKKQANHKNPERMIVDSRTQTARNVTLGAFRLTDSLVREIDAYQPLGIDEISKININERKITRTGDGLYIGNNPDSSQIGDLIIRFSHVLPTTVSIVAKQTGNTFKPYITSYDKPIEELVEGVATAEEIIEKAQSENSFLAWILRLVGFVMMFIGFALLFKPLSVLADIVPFVGNIVEFGTGIISFLLSSTISLTTIAIAWIFYRPLLAVGLISIAVTFVVFGVKKGKSRVKKRDEVRPSLSREKKTIEEKRDDTSDVEDEPSGSSKKTSVDDPFLIDE